MIAVLVGLSTAGENRHRVRGPAQVCAAAGALTLVVFTGYLIQLSR